MEIVRKSAEMHLQLLGEAKSKNKGQFYAGQGSGNKQNMQRRSELEREIQLIKKKKREIYEDMKDGILEKQDYEIEKNRLQLRIRQCEEEIKYLSYDEKPTEIPDHIFKLEGEDISLELLDEVVEKIIIVSRMQVEITYTYEDLVKKQLVES